MAQFSLFSYLFIDLFIHFKRLTQSAGLLCFPLYNLKQYTNRNKPETYLNKNTRKSKTMYHFESFVVDDVVLIAETCKQIFLNLKFKNDKEKSV